MNDAQGRKEMLITSFDEEERQVGSGDSWAEVKHVEGGEGGYKERTALRRSYHGLMRGQRWFRVMGWILL
jgi:hypothetical protein